MPNLQRFALFKGRYHGSPLLNVRLIYFLMGRLEDATGMRKTFMRRHHVSLRSRRLAFESLEQRNLLSVVPPVAPVPDAYQDLGVVDYRDVVPSPGSDAAWYRLRAQNEGTLTVIRGLTTASHLSAGPVAIYAELSQGLSLLGEGTGRVDLPVRAGQTVFVSLPSLQPGETLWIATLVQMAGSSMIVRGTAGADTFSYTGAGNGQVVINGIPYTLPQKWTTLAIVGANGGDEVSVETVSTNESVTVSPGSTQIVSAGRAISIREVAKITIQTSASAVSEIIDSPSDDLVIFRPRSVIVYGPEFQASIIGPQTIHAYSRAGGRDAVTFYDSAGSDQATYQAGVAILRGDGYYNRAKFFPVVTFIATTGEDTALLTGSPGNDVVRGQLGDVILQTSSATCQAVGFWTTLVRSGGGVDVAEVNDSPADDFVFAFPGDVSLFNLEHTLRLQGFAYSHIYARHGGFDTAYFYDSPGDDRFVGRPDASSMVAGPYFARVKFFDAVYAYSRNGGRDTASLYDSNGDDLLAVRPYYTRLEGNGFSNRVETFSTVMAFSGNGGSDRMEVYSSRGVDRVNLSATVSDVVFAETQTFVRASRFGSEKYFLEEHDVVTGQATRATIIRGGPATVINAGDYFDPTSPTLGFQRAIDALPREGGTVILPAGTFTLRQGLLVPSNVTLRGDPAGTTLVRKQQTFAFLTATARTGDQRLNVTSTAGFQVGGEIVLVSRSETAGQLYTIAGIEPGVLILDRPIERGVFRPEEGAEVTNLVPLVRATGSPLALVVNVTVENLVINGNLDPGYTRWRSLIQGSVELSYAVNSVVRNVTVVRSPTSGIVLINGHDNLVENSTVIEARYAGIAVGWESDTIVRGNLVRGIGYGMANTGWGEGILINGGRDHRVEGNVTEYNVGAGLHPAGDLTVGGLWINNISRYNQRNGFHYCLNNYGVWAVNNELYGNDRGVGGLGLGGEFADRFNVVMGNQIYNNQRGGIQINGGRDNYVIGNILRNNSQKSPGKFAEIALGEVWTTVVADNRITPLSGGSVIDASWARLYNILML